ncbi:MAG: PHP domain-containing protein [Planctomycetota bacterium]
MTIRSLLLWCAALAVVCFGPPVRAPVAPEVRSIDRKGNDLFCPPGLARVEMPKRDAPTLFAPLHDLAYAAADAGPMGCLWLLGAVVFLAIVRGLWSQGVKGALRRALLAVALGGPLGLALLYASCFVDGRVIRLGPEATEWVPASLHNHTDRSTGLLSPRDLVIWHVKRDFRVLNVSDKNTIKGGLLARDALARLVEEEGPLTPPLVVTVGDEWHGQPDIVFVHATREPQLPPEPERDLTPQERKAHRLRYLAELAAAVHADGGALFLAHPWSKVPGEMRLEEMFGAGLDGVEVFNGVIHGGDSWISTAVDANKALFGVLDYKFGPHVNTLTLLDARLAVTPEGVAKAVRSGATLVLYAVPRGPRSAAEWKAAQVGLRGAMEGLLSLREVPRARRAVWFGWGALGILLWWITTRRDRGLGRAAARTLFFACAAGELLLLALVSSQARAAIGTVPVAVVVAATAVLAVPLLVASHSLALLERRA